MGTEVIVGGIAAAIFIFFLSLSIVLNIVLMLVVGGLGWMLNGSMKNIQKLETDLTDLDSQLIMSDSINDIIEHILSLRENLYEVSQMEMYTGEPIITGLMENINSTLEKIESSVIKQEYMRSLEEQNGQE